MNIAEKRTSLWVASFIIATLFIAFILYIGFNILAKGLDKPDKLFITQPFVSLGRDARFVIGGILWVIGTVLFFAELFGYTIRWFRIVKQVIKWDAVDVSIGALTATVYDGTLAVTSGLPIIPGFTWIRQANALAPLFRILFGIPRALGTAIGNFIADALGVGLFSRKHLLGSSFIKSNRVLSYSPV